MTPCVEAIIFDFNGTLFNDSAFHNEAWSLFAGLHGKTLSTKDFDNHIHGYTNKEIIEFLFQRKTEELELQSYYEEKENIYRGICQNNPDQCILTKGAEVYLDYLSEKKIPRTIATASYLPNVEMYFELFNLKKWFSFEKVVYDSGEYRGKPYPDLFLAAAKKINTPINKCMVIEDSISGLQAAKNSGALKIVAVSFDSNPYKFSQFNFIDLIITDFSQLIPTE